MAANKNYVLIQEITVGAAGASSVTFNNIPQTGYTDLKIVASARTNDGSTQLSHIISFNGSTASRTDRYLIGSGSAASSGSGASTMRITWGLNGGGTTSNTFGNSEIYIPNYNSTSTNKSFSADGVLENNATAAGVGMTAGLWSSTAAITSVTLTPESGSYVQYSTFSLYGLAALGTTPTIAPKAAGGDIIVNDGTYWYHAFLSTGAFVPQVAISADVLVVAGGGGGGGTMYGQNGAGGGGAGGLLGFTNQSLSTTSYTCTIGAGGAGGSSAGALGVTGSDSQFGSLTLVKGGGGGGWVYGANGLNGGSGGGGAGNNGIAGTATSGQGYAGGNGGANSGNYSGGGGGGAGAVGGVGNSATYAGNGGAGVSTYSSWATATATGVSGYYAGGGAGGSYSTTMATGGSGGGGNGGYVSSSTNINPIAGISNTGGGGGGSHGAWSASAGANGGSGIILIRYSMV